MGVPKSVFRLSLNSGQRQLGAGPIWSPPSWPDPRWSRLCVWWGRGAQGTSTPTHGSGLSVRWQEIWGVWSDGSHCNLFKWWQRGACQKGDCPVMVGLDNADKTASTQEEQQDWQIRQGGGFRISQCDWVSLWKSQSVSASTCVRQTLGQQSNKKKKGLHRLLDVIAKDWGLRWAHPKRHG